MKTVLFMVMTRFVQGISFGWSPGLGPEQLRFARRAGCGGRAAGLLAAASLLFLAVLVCPGEAQRSSRWGLSYEDMASIGVRIVLDIATWQ